MICRRRERMAILRAVAVMIVALATRATHKASRRGTDHGLPAAIAVIYHALDDDRGAAAPRVSLVQNRPARLLLPTQLRRTKLKSGKRRQRMRPLSWFFFIRVMPRAGH